MVLSDNDKARAVAWLKNGKATTVVKGNERVDPSFITSTVRHPPSVMVLGLLGEMWALRTVHLAQRNDNECYRHAMKFKLKKKQLTSIPQLIEIKEMWHTGLEQGMLEKVFSSMPDWINECIEREGGHTIY